MSSNSPKDSSIPSAASHQHGPEIPKAGLHHHLQAPGGPATGFLGKISIEPFAKKASAQAKQKKLQGSSRFKPSPDTELTQLPMLKGL